MDLVRLKNKGVKPIIYEIIRTEVTFPNIRLLIEHVVVQDVGRDEEGALRRGYRIHLTDGEYRIQAVVRRRLYKYVRQSQLGRGSIVVLKQYDLATAKRLNGTGEIIHFAIADFYVIGYLELPRLELAEEPAKISEDRDSDKESSPDERSSQPKVQPSLPSKEPEPQSEPELSIGEDESGNPQAVTAPITKQQSTLSKDLALPRNPEWIRRASIEHHQRCHLLVEPLESQCCPPTDDQAFWKFCQDNPLSDHGMPCESISHSALLATMVGEPLKPFRDPPKIMPLASVTGRNKSRNKDVDILAVIVSIDESTIKPARLSLKRDIRVQDPSVEEPIVVGIFNDPINFRSSVGTLALFRHVTTHDWKKGSLNAYPARVGGRDWFIPNPYCLGLREDICHVESWWQKRQHHAIVEDPVTMKHTRNESHLKGR